MIQSHVNWIVEEFATYLGHKFDPFLLQKEQLNSISGERSNVDELIAQLNETASRVKVVFIEHSVDIDRMSEMLVELSLPVLVFQKDEDGVRPAILKYHPKSRTVKVNTFQESTGTSREIDLEVIKGFVEDQEGNIRYLTGFAYQSLVSEVEESASNTSLSPVNRLIRLLANERKDIYLLYVYAFIVAIVGLSLPLGVQAIISLVSSGVIFNTVILLIAFVILGTIIVGALQIMQLWIVEIIQRRVFTKAAFEFAFRVPRLKVEDILNYHVPELMNRFFEVMTIQKGLPKLLIDLSTGVLQIFFGLILLAFYHPFFVVFGLSLLGFLSTIIYLTGPKGLRTSIVESKYKYKVVYWLEELARTVSSFKITGYTSLPIKKTDYNVNNYLANRIDHFRVLITQYSYIILFKAVVTGGLLIIGSLLVIEKQITLGQFVASEIVIILILTSVEKIISYMDAVYDMLTAVDKIGTVTDLPLERSGGVKFPTNNTSGLSIRAKGLSYKYKGKSSPALKNISVTVKAGDRVCITGYNDSGKSTLLNILAGLYSNYEGIVTINNLSLREIDLPSLRHIIAKNISQDEIFEGTILENITLGKGTISYDDVIWAVEKVGLSDFINALPEGLESTLVSGGKTFSSSVINKLILARCVAQHPSLLILNDFFHNFQKSEKIKLIEFLTDPANPWTLLVSSDDPLLLEACNNVLVLKEGTLFMEGAYQELKENPVFREIVLNK